MLSLVLILFINSIPNIVISLEKNIFFSTKYREANVRNGPGTQNLIIFKILQKGYPVKVVNHYDNWKEIQDFKNRSGWISKSQLSREKFGIVLSDAQTLHKFPTVNSKKIAIINQNVLIRILKCKKKWCKVEIERKTGWLKKDAFWGSMD